MLLDLDGVRLLTDPLLRDRVSCLQRQVRGVDNEEYAGVDAVLISHLHFDHLDLPSLQRLGRRTPIIVPRGGGHLPQRRGFRHVAEERPGRRFGSVP